jgi:hypothetical protein
MSSTPLGQRRTVQDPNIEVADRAGGLAANEAALRAAYLERLVRSLAAALAHRASTREWGRDTARSLDHDRRDAEAETMLQRWAAYRNEPPAHEGLRVVARSVYGHSKVKLLDRRGVEVGEYRLPDGPLTLLDERARADAWKALTEYGIEQPAQLDLDALGEFPDAHIVPGKVWALRGFAGAGATRRTFTIGHYDPEARALVAYARPYVAPAAVLLRRHGVEPDSVTWAAPDDDTVRLDNHDTARARSSDSPARTVRLKLHLAHVLPDQHVRWLRPQWVGPDTKQLFPHRKKADLLADSSYRQELATLFGQNDPAECPAMPCRLCGELALGVSGLAYCFGCCRVAQRGVITDPGIDGPATDIAIWAIRRLVELEFSGPPSLAQLKRLTIADPVLADEAMLCRVLVPRPGFGGAAFQPERPLHAWVKWLQLAGVLDGGLRTSRGTATIATDGHPCRSLFERHIDDFFHRWRVEHETEPAYPRDAELNTTGLRADWRLADGTFVEALGFLDEPAYRVKVQRKTELAMRSGIRLVTVTAGELDKLPEVFASWIPSDDGAPSRLAPRTLTTEARRGMSS